MKSEVRKCASCDEDFNSRGGIVCKRCWNHFSSKDNRDVSNARHREWRSKPKNRQKDRNYSKKYGELHRDELKKKNKEWQENNLEYRDAWGKITRACIKTNALMICGGVECVTCGCTDIRLLELNMKTGGHNKLIKSNRMDVGSRLYLNIVKKRVDPDLFDVRCRVCNAYHYLELIFGSRYKIQYLGTPKDIILPKCKDIVLSKKKKFGTDPSKYFEILGI